MKINEIAVFGGGCFWCTEAVFKNLKGIVSATPGYAGGQKENPTYEEVHGGKTGHAEAIKIEFNPSEIGYRDLLTVFFATHDPTTPNRQGNDIGAEYRSIILYTNEAQRAEAERFIKELDAEHPGGAPIVTEVRPFDKFYEAEEYHRDYYAKNSGNPYCQLVINPKLKKVQEKFAKLLKEQEWKNILTPEQYKSMREKGTEAPFSGKLLYEKSNGIYRCAACGNPLFLSGAKFESGTGWPSFDNALPGAVKEERDTSFGEERTEILCTRCGSHLGHVFNDGPTPTNKRYCMNSVCLDFKKGSASVIK